MLPAALQNADVVAVDIASVLHTMPMFVVAQQALCWSVCQLQAVQACILVACQHLYLSTMLDSLSCSCTKCFEYAKPSALLLFL